MVDIIGAYAEGKTIVSLEDIGIGFDIVAVVGTVSGDIISEIGVIFLGFSDDIDCFGRVAVVESRKAGLVALFIE